MSVLNLLMRLRQGGESSCPKSLVQNLSEAHGVVASFVSSRQDGVIFVAYRVTETNSADLLRTVEGLGYEADIIGY